MNRVAKFLSVAIVGVVCTFGYAYSNIVHAMLVGTSDFVELEPRLYVSGHLDRQEQERFTALLAKAQARITQVYGSVSATPIMIVTKGIEEASQYGLGESPGTLFSAPWQQYLIVNYEKLEGVDVIAHELVHAELVERLGYIKKMLQIPTWYDEGVAMQVDYRAKYSVDSVGEQAIEAVKELSSPAMFWTDNQIQTIENYRAAKKTVADSFRVSGPSRLYETLSRIKSGETFSKVVGTKKQ